MDEDRIESSATANDVLPATKSAYVDLAAISARERGEELLSATLPGGFFPLACLLFPLAFGVVALVKRGANDDYANKITNFGWICTLIYLICLLPVLHRRFKKPLGFSCTHCDKHLSTDPDWKCGFCNSIHCTSGLLQSFERPCSKCNRLAKGYRCYHCGRTVYLDATCDGRNPATAAYEKYPSEEEQLAMAQREAATADPVEQTRAVAESTINKMVAEQAAFNMITGKVCEVRDAAIKKINDSDLDTDTKRTRIEYEKQWAKTQLESIKMQAIKGRK